MCITKEKYSIITLTDCRQPLQDGLSTRISGEIYARIRQYKSLCQRSPIFINPLNQMVPKENNIKIVITLYESLYRDNNTHFTYKKHRYTNNYGNVDNK